MNAASAADVQRTFAAVDLNALRNNVRLLTRRFGSICAVVKADAYGHGLVPCARAAVSGGAAAIAVATPAEGQLLRGCGLHLPIHILSPAEPLAARICVTQRLTPHISSIAFLNAFLEAGGKIKDCFLMLDSGMGREGLIVTDDIEGIVTRNGSGCFGGISTHLACADAAEDVSLRKQYTHFGSSLERLKKQNVIDDSTIVSINNSAGMLWDVAIPGLPNPLLHRPGALIYGIAPSVNIPSITTPVLTWRARIHLIKTLPIGHAIGYGATYTTERTQRIATIGVGYADGYPRHISPETAILVRGQFARIVGVVSMDQLQVDVTDIPDVTEGDWVTLIGCEGTTCISVAQLAAWGDVPVQWPTSGLSPRVPRRYTGLE